MAQELIINQISVYNIHRQQLAIEKWRSALRSAENLHLPQRKAIYDIYHDLLLDAHLHALYKKRVRNITNTPVRFEVNGQEDEKAMEYVKAPWFTRTVELIMDAIFWGHSLIEFDVRGKFIEKAILIPRHHVLQKQGIISLQSPYNTSGIPYREEPYSRYTLEVNLPDSANFYGLGLLNIAASNTILKRNGSIDFANFIEMFGAPIREYQYDPSIAGAKEEAERAARDTGNSGAIVVPKNYADLKLHNGVNASSQDLHVNFLNDLRDELTILILGQTMTTKDGSSRSQAEVHQSVEQQVVHDDRLFVEYMLNWELKEKLVGMGIPLNAKGAFVFDTSESLTLKEQVDIDLRIAQQYHVPASYFSEKYGLPVQDRKQGVAEGGTTPTEKKK